MPKLIYHDSDGVDKVLVLGSDPLLVGRATECQVQTQDAMVSRRHARIYWDGNYWIEDLGSSNGVFVGHEKVQRAPFRPGDVVTCGSLVMRMVPDATPRQSVPNLGATMTPPPAPPPREPARPAPPPTGPQGQVQIGPNAFLRGTTALPSAAAAAAVGDELTVERERRERAEQALGTAQRKLEQAQADLRRLRGGGAAEPSVDNEELTALRQRVAELEAAQRSGVGALGTYDPALLDKVAQASDALAELRVSLRAANGEAGLLTEPSESVQVVTEALRAAAEQLENARAIMRALNRLVGGNSG